MWRLTCVSVLSCLLGCVSTQECPPQLFWSASANIPGTDKVKPVSEMLNEESFHVVDQYVPILCKNVRDWRYLFDLKISNSKLRYIQPGAFKKMNLLYLSLSKNNLTVITEGIFNDLPVKSLDLSENQIMHIKEKAFDRMPNLQAINLNDNAISTLNPNWFRFSPNLHKIYFKNNLLEEIPRFAFKYMKEDPYTSVVLTDNKISLLHAEAFGNFRRYGAFWLSNNLIQNVPEDLFLSSERNFELNLQFNQISYISEATLGKLFNACKLINISNNSLACATIRNLRIHFHQVIQKDTDVQSTHLKFDDSGRCRHDMRLLLKYMMHNSTQPL